MQKYKKEISTEGLSWEECSEKGLYTKNREIRRYNRTIDLNLLRNFLMENGFHHIIVHYHGAGDSGEAFFAEGYKKGEKPEPHIWEGEDMHYGEWIGGEKVYKEGKDEFTGMTHHQKELDQLYRKFTKDKELRFLTDDLSDTLVQLIDYDWYNNDGGQGYIVWDLRSGDILIAGEQNYTDVNDVTEHINVGKYSPEEVN